MSVEFYSGTPGSGKSLHAAGDICTALKAGKPVIANFPINLEYFKKRDGSFPKHLGKFYYVPNANMNVSFLKHFSKENLKHFREHQCLIVIDECAVLFNPRACDRKDRQDWVTFFTQHRKYGYDVILISQSDCLIDRQIRAMFETEYKHRALSNYGLAGWFMSLFLGKWFWVNQYWYGCRMKLGSDLMRFKKKQAGIYDSFKIFDEDEEIESQPEQKAEVVENPKPEGLKEEKEDGAIQKAS